MSENEIQAEEPQNEWLSQLLVDCDASVSPVEERVDLGRYTRLDLTPAEKIQLSGLAQLLPAAKAATMGSGEPLYRLTFPEGLPHTLMKLKDRSGFTTDVIGLKGIIKGKAAINPVDMSPMAAMAALSAVSAAANQYALAQIADELSVIKSTLDSILNFLYGDKRAELISEIEFIKSAFQNYRSIMRHEAQRVATLQNVQVARKIALQDITFYLSDLEESVKSERKGAKEQEEAAQKALNAHKSLNLSLQLYSASVLLEVYYSRNTDESFLRYLEETAESLIDQCSRRQNTCFSALHERLKSYKPPLGQRLDDRLLKTIEEVSTAFSDGTTPQNHGDIRQALRRAGQEEQYLASRDGNIYYLRTA